MVPPIVRSDRKMSMKTSIFREALSKIGSILVASNPSKDDMSPTKRGSVYQK
jgi:hypothetical protein